MFEDIKELVKEYEQLEGVEAFAVGGSRASGNSDKTSDYDVYIYLTKEIDASTRKAILAKYCKYLEIGNHYWELEDDCTLKNGIDKLEPHTRLFIFE